MQVRKSVAAFCGLALFIWAAPAFAEDHRVTVENAGDATMTHLYATSDDDDDWDTAHDWLGRYYLHPGEQMRINFDDGDDDCIMDLKAVFDNGVSVVRRHVNVCAVVRWQITRYHNSLY